MQNFDLNVLIYPALALAAVVAIYNIVYFVVRHSARLIGALVAIPLGIYAANSIMERMGWTVDMAVYAQWLSGLFHSGG